MGPSVPECTASILSRLRRDGFHSRGLGVALGLGLRFCYDGDITSVSEDEWAHLGFNKSSVHTDIVSTTDRTVTARLRDGSERVIYAGGQFKD